MPKARKSSARKSSARPSPARPRPVAATRSLKRGNNRAGSGRSVRPTTRKRDEDIAVTRVTHETEVRGTETRVERVVERALKPTLPDVDRAAGRGRYVYCI